MATGIRDDEIMAVKADSTRTVKITARKGNSVQNFLPIFVKSLDGTVPGIHHVSITLIVAGGAGRLSELLRPFSQFAPALQAVTLVVKDKNAVVALVYGHDLVLTYGCNSPDIEGTALIGSRRNDLEGLDFVVLDRLPMEEVHGLHGEDHHDHADQDPNDVFAPSRGSRGFSHGFGRFGLHPDGIFRALFFTRCHEASLETLDLDGLRRI